MYIVIVKKIDDLRPRKQSITKIGSLLSRSVSVKYVESARKRQQTIYKRRSTLFKKAKELSVMAGADIALNYKDDEKTYTFFSSDSIKKNLINA